MAVSARWPLHPCPQPHESLSSWISRLAQEYNLSAGELLRNTLSIKPIRNHLIDRDPPNDLIIKLAACTGVHETSIRAMTLQGYVPWIIDTLNIYDSECLKLYASQYRILLPSNIKWMSSGIRKRYKKRITYCLPWIVEPYGKEYPLCVECLRTDLIPYERIFWRLGIMASCPIHRCLLDASDYLVEKLIPACVPTEPADEYLLFIDRLTFQAITVGEVILANGHSMNVAVYVRFLRSLIEEIFCRPSSMRRCKYVFFDMWDHLDIEPWGRVNSLLFERLSLPYRRDVLRIIGFLLHDMPQSIMIWQTATFNNPEERKQLPSAIAETFYDQGHCS